MKAVIMAGGEGTRLRPLTSNLPKPMMPLVNRPMMEHIVELLRSHGIDEIVVTVAYMSNVIRNYFGDGSELGVRMVYATEETPLGTAGSVRNAMEELDERFLVISGDVLTDIDLSQIMAFHEEKGALATIGLARVENPLEFGIVITREDGHVERFLEKPGWGQVFSDTINTGIFVLEPEIFDHIQPGRPVDFSSEVFPSLLEAGLPLYGAVCDGYWEDVGTLDAYLRAHKDILDGRVKLGIEGFELRDGVWLGENAVLHPDAVVEGPAVIGDNCRVEADTRVGGYVVLGANTRVRAGSTLERVVVHDNTYLGDGVRLRGTVVGRSCDLRAGVRTDEGVVLGDECFVGEDAVIATDVKVYPFKTVEAGAVVNSSIVWETKGARSLFGEDGIAGLANVDVTPELATRVAMAYATTLKSGSTVVMSRDSSRSARMLKRSMMAGLNAAGVNVEDLEVATLPVTRFTIRRPSISGGIAIGLAEDDGQSVRIRFFDGAGMDLDEAARRKVERLFGREDYRRVFPGEIGDIGFLPRALAHYATAMESVVDTERMAEAGHKVVLDYSYSGTSFVMPNVLSRLGIEALVVNPFASTAGVLSRDVDQQIAQVADLVRASGSSLGAVIDPDGERFHLVDDTGHVLSDVEVLLTFLSLLEGTDGRTGVALPVSTTDRAVEIAKDAGFEVIPTEMSSSALMAAAAQPEIALAGDQEGSIILPSFLPAPDAAANLVHLLDLLTMRGTRLSQVVSGLPKVFMAHERVVTPWEQKGVVMRTLVEQTKNRDIHLVDGVKVRHGEGWVLAFPDPDEPVTHLWSEGSSAREASDLVAEYVRRIRQLVR